MSGKEKVRNVLLILTGVFILLLKKNYNGPWMEIIINYAGNFSVSFAVYFIINFISDYWKKNKLITAAISLLIVELFEVTNGFFVMQNVFDPYDLIANFAGIILAIAIDQLFDTDRKDKILV